MSSFDFVKYCNICQKPFNSACSSEDHFNSSDHKRREEAMMANQTQNKGLFFCSTCSISCNSIRTFQEHNISQSHLERCKRQLAAQRSGSIEERQGEHYFDNQLQRGRCNICDIELTSIAHAKQHLNGTKHKKLKLRPGEIVNFPGTNITTTSQLSNSDNESQFSQPLEPGSSYVSVQEIQSMMSGLQFNSKPEAANYDMSNDPTSYCKVCRVSFSGPFNAEQHYASDKHKKRHMLPETNFSIPENNLAHATKLLSAAGHSSNMQRSLGTSAEKDQQESSDYSFNGSTGYCFLCNIQLTSGAHKDQHIFGAKHQKAATLKHSSFNPSGLQTSVLQQSMKSDNCSSDTYSFNHGRGRCFVCNIELTSPEHAKQHLSGQKHKKAEQQSKDFNSNQYHPLTCDVCCMNFSGQESAKQHFVSRKHQQKSALTISIKQGDAAIWGDFAAMSNPGDRTHWLYCDVCDCVLNSTEQLQVHYQSPKHMAKKLKKETFVSGSGSERSLDMDQNLQDLNAASYSSTSSQELEIINRKMESLKQRKEYLLQQKSNGGQQAVARPADGLPFPVIPKLENQPRYLNNNNIRFQENLDDEQTRLKSVYHPETDHLTNYNKPPTQISNLIQNLNSSDNTRKMSFPPTANNYGDFQVLNNNNNHPLVQGKPLVPNIPDIDSHFSSDEDTNDSSLFGDGSLFADGLKKKQIKKLSLVKNHAPKHSKMTCMDLTEEQTNIPPSLTDDDDQLSLMTTSSDGRRENIKSEVNSLVSESTDTDLESENGSPRKVYLGAIPKNTSRSPFHKFHCEICNRPMNTEKALDDHKKGRYHLQMVARMTAPRSDLPSVKKSIEVDLLETYDITQKTTPRLYQVELFMKAMKNDHVCFLPTGTGKTLVSVMVMSYMLQKNPTRPVLFLVDKTLLAIQQGLYIIKELKDRLYNRPVLSGEVVFELTERSLQIAILSGGIQKVEPIPLWRHDIIVTTAAYCENLLLKEVIHWEDFSLIVLDEVHHCVKQHPYCTLITNSHKPLEEKMRPKLLGLTASPAGKETVDATICMLNSLLQNLGDVRIGIVEGELENKKLDEFQSTACLHVVCQPISNQEEDFHMNLKIHLMYCYKKFADLTDIGKQNINGFPKSTDGPRQIEKLAMDLEYEARSIFQYTLDFCQPNSSENKISMDLLRLHTKKILLALSDSENGSVTFAMPELQKMLSTSKGPHFSSAVNLGIPCDNLIQSMSTWVTEQEQAGASGAKDDALQTATFRELINALNNPEYISWSHETDLALILVQTRSAAKILSKTLQNIACLKGRKVTHLVGHGAGGEDGMRVQMQKRTLQGIKNNKFDIVVATSIAEEGVDIPECQLVVSLNPPSNVTALVQMRGRARKKGSHFVIICNTEKKMGKINTLIQREENMTKAAKIIAKQQKFKF